MLSSEKSFTFNSENAALCAYNAVLPEINRLSGWRSKAQMHTNKNVVSLKVLSEDGPALKASVNSYSRLLGLCEKVSLL